MALRRGVSMQEWLLLRRWQEANPATVDVCDSGFWVMRHATRTTNRGTERRKRFIMFVITIPDGGQPTLEQETLRRSIDLVAKTRQPRIQRSGGKFTPYHEQNIRLVKDKDVVVQCYGAHILRMSGRNPEASKWLMWDDHPIELDQFMSLLQFDIDPDTFKELEPDTMHKPRVKERGLFDVGKHPLDEDEDEDK